MFSKVKCPKCGAKNSKERMTCAECGAPLTLSQAEVQVTEVPPEGKPTVMTPTQETQRAPEPIYPPQPIAKSDQRTTTGLFGGIEEALRDKTRDELCASLCAIGLHAQMAERGQPEEHVKAHFGRAESIGLIETRDSSIRWVNVLKEEVTESSQYNITTHTTYSTAYIIPDLTVRQETPPESIRVIARPIFPPVDKLRWVSARVVSPGRRQKEHRTIKSRLG